jgi:hypothetical protein
MLLWELFIVNHLMKKFGSCYLQHKAGRKVGQEHVANSK